MFIIVWLHALHVNTYNINQLLQCNWINNTFLQSVIQCEFPNNYNVRWQFYCTHSISKAKVNVHMKYDTFECFLVTWNMI